ncbi:toll/interleukin-1 receptor domain-containing protein [Rhizobium leguminosarum]|uniref:toll/interleukin-1 receptor domain-containing protein n=1 Tax=Rhizobium leguminosarum TaxID=384 RepID=UPI0032B1568D
MNNGESRSSKPRSSLLTKIFISHTGDQGLVVKKLVNELRRAGQHVFVDLDMLPDDDVEQQITNGLESAEVFVLVISGPIPEWTADEIEVARAYGRTRSLLIIPVLIGEGRVPPQLKYNKAVKAGDREPSAYIADILAIIEGDKERKERFAARKVEVERDLAVFVNEAVVRQHEHEAKNRRAAQLWHAAGIAFLLLVLVFAGASSYTALATASSVATYTSVLIIGLLDLVIIGVLTALARYAYSLGKSYMSEALKSADRIHAIQFGKFFLSVYGEKLSPTEVKEAFQHWNIDRTSTFASLDSKEIDPQIYALVSQLMGALSNKKAA